MSEPTTAPSRDEGHEAYRGELLAHCYRMLGSFDEAEDLVQETLLRAWRAADRYDPQRASLRTWLHRIATNACLTALEGRARRPLPSGLGPAGDDPHAPLVPSPDIPWLQPFPDTRLGDPADAAQQRVGLRLAFVAALQLLPARQRAALVLREVLQLPAAEVARALGSSVASVNSGLQRARATLRDAGLSLEGLREPAEPAERAVIERYLAAFEAADVPGLTRLLADDVVLEMPPVPLWLAGRAHYREFMDRVFAMRGPGWRLLPVRANGSPALAAYAPDPARGGVRAHSLQVFTVTGGLIRHCVTFADPTVFDLLGLPHVPSDAELQRVSPLVDHARRLGKVSVSNQE
ncbi:sigma-70 family RNA polymerase sigma factor [Pseudofrankia asymbiotica]|uniref:sigma-70 family RNA polymerase sigma factor n=1 Tax=Pseudofrankia asymbiotica TaxID=1834516 RepID=UPI0009766476|nr:sigma-70 family RNA polymerase sigma factor [Pseudofrankia asymbiotica]